MSPVVLWEGNGTVLSCNLVFVTIDQLDLCAITSLFQSTVVIMSLRQKWGLHMHMTPIPEIRFKQTASHRRADEKSGWIKKMLSVELCIVISSS